MFAVVAASAWLQSTRWGGSDGNSGHENDGEKTMINAAMIGLGRWGQSIIGAVQGKSTRVRFVHGVTKEPELAKNFAARHGFRLSTDLADALADPLVQAVWLATPHSLHLQQVEAVTATGRPVWCEKPLSLTRAEAERAVAACRKAGVPQGSGNNKRCFASMRELAGLVKSGTLGDILHVEGHFSNEHSTRVGRGSWRDDPRESPAAGLTGAGLHVLDAFVNLAGPLRRVDARVFARKPSPDPRDVLAVLVDFASSATGLMATVRAAPTVWRIHVFCTDGWVEARGEDTLTVARMHEEPVTTVYPHVDSLLVLVDAFADAIEGKAPFPVSQEQMLDVIGAFEAVVTSADRGEPVML
jgi:predicted dehydrogenase